MKQLTTVVILGCCAALAQGKTIYTGDTLLGVPVISQLDIKDLEANKVHKFMFQGTSNGIAQYWYVPVLVAKGSTEGKRLGLQSSIHGDELNGLHTIWQVFDKIDTSKLKGAVIAAVGANPSGMIANNRNWQIGNDGGAMVDFNRIWPGKKEGDPADQHAYKLWNHLWADNVDMFVDLHTQSTGTAYPLYIYADYRNEAIKKMAELIPADQIKMDPGEKGSVETTFVEKGIPAITLEVGKPKSYQPELVARSVVGIKNIMIENDMINESIGQTAKDVNTFIGNEMVSIRAKVGGFAEIFVKLGDMVEKDQKVAIQRNAFGEIIQTYNAPTAGKVLAIGDDPVREPRALLVRILFQNPDAKCNKGC